MEKSTKPPEKENMDAPQEEFISNDPPSATENEGTPKLNPEKNPDDRTTGNKTMTGSQQSDLKTLSQEARVEFDDSLSKAEASKTIEALQEQVGRGSNTVRE